MNKWGKRVLAGALTCVLACAAVLAGGPALAATTSVGDTGSISISGAVNGNYYAYQLFDGTFRDDDDGTLQMGDAVLNEDYAEAILEALEQLDDAYGEDDGVSYVPKLSGLSERAQADAILDSFLLLESNSRMAVFANVLAQELEEEGVEPTATATASDGVVAFADLSCGYWLVKQDSKAASETDYAITSALLIAVDGDEDVQAKVSVPTVEKYVIDNDSSSTNEDTDGDGVDDLRGDGEFGKTADVGASSDDALELCSISYKVNGSVSGNIADFDTYYYAFHDQLPEFISLGTSRTNASSKRLTNERDTDESWEGTGDPWEIIIVVESGYFDVTRYFTASYTADSDGLTTVHWECEDLIAVFNALGIPSDEWADALIVLQYEIPLTEDEATAYLEQTSSLDVLYAETNYVWVEYTNNPYANNPVSGGVGSTTETPEDLNRVYSFNLEISKVDEAGALLSGATFELTREVTLDDDSTETVSAGYLVVDDGEVLVEGDSMSYEDGVFVFTGLEADVAYTLTEVSVPSGYKSIDPITFTISAHLDETGYEIVSISVDPETTTDPSGATVLSTSDATVLMTVMNVEGYDPPLTGMAGVAAGTAVGAALVFVALASYRRRHAQDKDEAERAA